MEGMRSFGQTIRTVLVVVLIASALGCQEKTTSVTPVETPIEIIPDYYGRWIGYIPLADEATLQFAVFIDGGYVAVEVSGVMSLSEITFNEDGSASFIMSFTADAVQDDPLADGFASTTLDVLYLDSSTTHTYHATVLSQEGLDVFVISIESDADLALPAAFLMYIDNTGRAYFTPNMYSASLNDLIAGVNLPALDFDHPYDLAP